MNPGIRFEVLIHKVDGLASENKFEIVEYVANRVDKNLRDVNLLDVVIRLD